MNDRFQVGEGGIGGLNALVERQIVRLIKDGGAAVQVGIAGERDADVVLILRMGRGGQRGDGKSDDQDELVIRAVLMMRELLGYLVENYGEDVCSASGVLREFHRISISGIDAVEEQLEGAVRLCTEGDLRTEE